jgi:hypothetical protein
MNLQAFPQVMRFGFGQLAAFSTGFGRKGGQLILAACQDGPVTLLQDDSLSFSQFLAGVFRERDAGLSQRRFICLKIMKQQRLKYRTRKQRIEALLASLGLQGEVLNVFCRKRGLFTHQVQNWKEDFKNHPRSEIAESCQVSINAAKPLRSGPAVSNAPHTESLFKTMK